jgi:flagellar protein FliO/FliZ
MFLRPPSWITTLITIQVLYAGGATANTAVSPTASSGGATWYSLVTLTLLVVLVAVALRVYKRMAGSGPADPQLQVLARQNLGPREQILVVKIQDRFFALGYTPSQISVIAELEEYTPTSLPQAALPSGFSELLSKARLKERQS